MLEVRDFETDELMHVFVNPEDYSTMKYSLIKINDEGIAALFPSESVEKGTIGIPLYLRRKYSIKLNDSVKISPIECEVMDTVVFAPLEETAARFTGNFSLILMESKCTFKNYFLVKGDVLPIKFFNSVFYFKVVLCSESSGGIVTSKDVISCKQKPTTLGKSQIIRPYQFKMFGGYKDQINVLKTILTNSERLKALRAKVPQTICCVVGDGCGKTLLGRILEAESQWPTVFADGCYPDKAEDKLVIIDNYTPDIVIKKHKYPTIVLTSELTQTYKFSMILEFGTPNNDERREIIEKMVPEGSTVDTERVWKETDGFSVTEINALLTRKPMKLLANWIQSGRVKDKVPIEFMSEQILADEDVVIPHEYSISENGEALLTEDDEDSEERIEEPVSDDEDPFASISSQIPITVYKKEVSDDEDPFASLSTSTGTSNNDEDDPFVAITQIPQTTQKKPVLTGLKTIAQKEQDKSSPNAPPDFTMFGRR